MSVHSYLFVPGERPERFSKALESGAERIILDLEDAVAPAAKGTARAALAEWLQARGGPDTRILVRVNGINTPWHADDMALAALPAVAGIMLPKSEERAALSAVRARLHPGQELHALVESVAGLVNLREIAGTPGLTRIAFGSVDFCGDAGIGGDDRELDAIRTQLVIESRYARLPAPVDGVALAIDDAAALEAEVLRARRFGFGAKLCIHPKQVALVQRGFLPSDQERAWAERVLAAVAADPHGAIAIDGKLVDKPVVDRARAISAAAVRP